MCCGDIVHPGQSCLQFNGMKTKQYYKEVIKMQLLVTLLPNLLQKYKTLDRHTILKAIKKFVVATVWLVMCYQIPCLANCMLWNFSPVTSKIIYLIFFFLGSCGCIMDTPSRLKQYGTFMAAKVFEFLIACLVFRGLISKVFYRKYLQIVAQALALGVLAVGCD